MVRPGDGRGAGCPSQCNNIPDPVPDTELEGLLRLLHLLHFTRIYIYVGVKGWIVRVLRVFVFSAVPRNTVTRRPTCSP